MKKLSLNSIHFAACSEYTSYLQTGLKGFKEKADNLMAEYKNRGGKKELKYVK